MLNEVDSQILELQDQARSIPQLWREPSTLTSEFELLGSPARVLLIGSGDSAIAARIVAARHQRGGIDVSAHNPCDELQFRSSDLVVGISASGGNPRLAETLSLAQEARATTVAATCQPGSQVAFHANHILRVVIPPLSPSPACLTYVATLMAIDGLLSGITNGNSIKSSLWERYGRRLESTTTQIADAARTVGLRLAGHQPPAIAAAARDLGTAQFIANKIIECTGLPVLCQDLDTWSHLGRFATRGPLLVWAPELKTSSPDMSFLGNKAEDWCESVAVLGPSVPSWGKTVGWPVEGPDATIVWGAVFAAELAADLALRRGSRPFAPLR